MILTFQIIAQNRFTVKEFMIQDTSFSAPRVAWLLALSEAYREKEVEKSDWLANLNNKLFKIRKKIFNADNHDYTDFSHIWLDPIKLLKNIKNLEDKNDQKF
jgi:hypothetical protein